MKHRSIAAVIILTLITLGLYGIYWGVVTAREMRKLGANIPNAILMIIPIANFYWFWRYSEGVDKVTNGKWSAPLVFILFILTGIGGIVLGQVAFNEDVSATPQAASESGVNLSGEATTTVPGVGAPTAVGGAVGAASQPTEAASADSATTVASADTSQTTETPTDSSSVSESSDLSTSPEVESTADSATASEEPATTEASSSDSSEPTDTTPSEPTTPVSSEPVSPPSSSDDNQNSSLG